MTYEYPKCDSLLDFNTVVVETQIAYVLLQVAKESNKFKGPERLRMIHAARNHYDKALDLLVQFPYAEV